MKQTIAFIVGVGFSTLFQWWKWTVTHKGKPYLAFWRDAGFPHLMGNAGIDVCIWALWSLQVLDKVINMGLDAVHLEMKQFREMGIPYIPQVGLMVGFAADMAGEPLAFIAGKLLPKVPIVGQYFDKGGSNDAKGPGVPDAELPGPQG